MTSRPRTVLVSMPWASTDRPNLGVGTLVAQLRRSGFACRARYPNLSLARTLGVEVYGTFSETPALFGLAEHLFAVSLFGVDELQSEDFLTGFATRADGSVDHGGRTSLESLRDDVIPRFIDRATRELLAEDADVYGFSCTFHQVMASLAVARRLKAARPDALVIFGGACVHGEMGETYARLFQETVDHVFVGEADHSLPAFVASVEAGTCDVRAIAGVTLRGQLPIPPALTFRLGDLPVPDYTDYFDELALADPSGSILRPSAIPFEGSRGCWWGARHHCTFCGLNNEGLVYRAKSPGRIVQELRDLAGAYGHLDFMAADNIMATEGYRSFLPQLANQGLDYRLFFEIKANVNRAQVAALARAGVRSVQPGIEHFADHVLEIMRKGTTGLQNVMLLRLLAEYGVSPSYNILVAFDGERDEDYLELRRAISAIRHLAPPSGPATPVQVHRFSPFHFEPHRHGIHDVQPASFYSRLVPERLGGHRNFAYFFDRRIPDDAPVWRHLPDLNADLAQWRAQRGQRVARLGPGFIQIEKSVDGVIETSRRLAPESSAILIAADRPRARGTLVSELARRLDSTEADVAEAVERLVDSGDLLASGHQVVSVVPFSLPQSDESLGDWLARNVERTHSEPDLAASRTRSVS
jgi:ribosomal peptide maturation radical SAM protein 1